MEKNKIVGFQSGHDVSYCILENGVPIIHEELERFTREKEPLGDGLKFFFEQNPNMKNINHFTFGNPGGRTGKWRNKCGELDSENKMMEILNGDREFYEMGHHQSHAANAFFSSNFDESLIVTIDGGGREKDGVVTAFTIWTGKDTKITEVEIIPINKINIGGIWSKCTGNIFGLSTGYPYGHQAGTVMGMACLGKPKYLDDFYKAIKHNSGVNYDKFKKLAEESEQNRFDIAASLQVATEKVTKEIMMPFVEKYKMKKLCLSGGAALNSVMVGKMYEWFDEIVDEIYVDPIPYDGGLALGSARYLWHHILDNPRIKWEDNSTPYLGRTYTEKTISKTLDKYSVEYKYVDDNKVVELLTENNNVISVFGGGSESGRRALGNRSILADPRSPDMKDIINEKVKHRQWFRPFAPSVLREDVDEWFDRDVDSPYMTTVIKFKEEVRDKVPAVVHFDGSARLQTVTENDNEWYHNFIKKFKEKTGVPIVLNTSFNDREPIVETPEHAINCFLGTDIDYLYFYDVKILVEKQK
tara:strand:+ start:5922 stop:7505 length:1584 start_codon:yes stop_codon:yes gene_type:complete